MIIFQVHLGNIHKERVQCIESIKSVYNDIPYIWVDDDNVDLYLEEMTEDLKITKNERFNKNHPKGKVIISDWLGFWMCSKDPEIMRICTDVYAHEKISNNLFINKSLPYMMERTRGNKICDYAVTYSNNPEWFKNILEINKHHPNVFINKFSVKRMNLIPKKYFTHLSGKKDTKEEHWQKRYWGW